MEIRLPISGMPNKEQVVAVSGGGKRVFPPFGSGPAELPEDEMPTVIYVNNGESVANMIPIR